MKSAHKGVRTRSVYFISCPNKPIPFTLEDKDWENDPKRCAVWFNVDTRKWEDYNPKNKMSSLQVVLSIKKVHKEVNKIMRQYKTDVVVSFERGNDYKVFDFIYKGEIKRS